MADWVDEITHCWLIQAKLFTASNNEHQIFHIVKMSRCDLRSKAHPQIDYINCLQADCNDITKKGEMVH